MKSMWLLASALTFVILASCNQGLTLNRAEATLPVPTTTPVGEIQAPPLPTTLEAPLWRPTQEAASQNTPRPEEDDMPLTDSPPPPYDPALQPMVQQVLADLAQRLAIDADQIEVVAVQAVVWPDASLGCPQAGMRYIQALQDGALIQLRAAGNLYEYHSGGGRDPFLCEQTLKIKSIPPKLDGFLPTPGDEDK